MKCKPRKYAELIAQEVPQAELVVIPGAGHVLIWEKPGVFNSVVLGFVLKHSIHER